MSSMMTEHILKCRSVCKRWTFGVDNYLDTHASMEPYTDCDFDENVLSLSSFFLEEVTLLPYSIIIMGTQMMEQISLSIIENPTQKPFVGRSINFVCSNDESTGENGDQISANFFENMCNVLRKVGKYVWHISVRAIFKNHSLPQFYLNFYKFLCLVPGIKSLCFDGIIKRECSFDELKQTQNLFDQIPLPKCKVLSTIKLEVKFLPIKIEQYIFQSLGNTVKKIHLNFYNAKFHDIHLCCPNLTELVIEGTDDVYFIKNMLNHMNVCKIRLKKFVGHFSSFEDILVIFDSLRAFDVKVVHILSSHSLFEGKLNDFSPIFSVHSLKIVDGLLLKFNFLCCLPNLQRLCIHTHSGMYNSETMSENKAGLPLVKGMIRDCLCRDMAPPSLFWDMFPNLKIVHIVDCNLEASSQFAGTGKSFFRYRCCASL